MSTQALVPMPAMAPFVRRVRAYFAPVARATGVPAAFDSSTAAGFNLDSPPAPWLDLGWVEGFARDSQTTYVAVHGGSPAVARSQVRQSVDATVALKFKSWGKLQLALCAGSEHLNVLTGAAVSVAATGNSASFVALGTGQTAGFVAGQMVVVDVDYAGQTGYVGSGAAGAHVRLASSVAADANYANYVRRVSLNVGRVTAVTANGLQLALPLAAGVPVAGMQVQQVASFVDREGGSFFQEWSALFVMAGEQGERVLFYYPRLQTMASASELVDAMKTSAGDSLGSLALEGKFRAMPVTDVMDGQQVLCYRTFVPAATALLR